MQPHQLLLLKKQIGAQNQAGRFSFDYETLRFANRFHADHRDTFDPKAEHARPEPFTDMWASIFSHLVANRVLDRTVMRDIFYCGVDALLDQGYELISLPRDALPPAKTHLAMLVAGCQPNIVLKSRVYAAAEFYHLVSTQTNCTQHCLLSGAHPPGNARFANPVEHSKMAHHFREYLGARRGKLVQEFDIEPGILDREVEYDESATKTDANIDAFCAMISDRFIHQRPKPPLRTIVAVTSTFHLIRLAPLLEARISQLWHEYGESTPEPLDIVLVGSETANGIDDPEKAPVVWHPRYTKLLYLEVFNYLAQRGLLTR